MVPTTDPPLRPVIGLNKTMTVRPLFRDTALKQISTLGRHLQATDKQCSPKYVSLQLTPCRSAIHLDNGHLLMSRSIVPKFDSLTTKETTHNSPVCTYLYVSVKLDCWLNF